MALDHPNRVDRLAVLYILPTETVWDRADARFALAFWPWSLLAQPQPLPERILAAVPQAIVDNALGGWGSPSAMLSAGHFFPEEAPEQTAEALNCFFGSGRRVCSLG
jgi:haloacetate dehalogenase